METQTKPRRKSRGITVKVTVSEVAWALLMFTVLSQSVMLTILLLNTGGE
jgi:hypothetical protein